MKAGRFAALAAAVSLALACPVPGSVAAAADNTCKSSPCDRAGQTAGINGSVRRRPAPAENVHLANLFLLVALGLLGVMIPVIVTRERGGR